MFIEDYQPEEATYFDVADGVHDMKIVGVKEDRTKQGKRMLVVSYEVRECRSVKYIENVVEGEYFNVNVTRIFDAFGIQRGNFNYQAWINQYGKGMFNHREETYTDRYGNQKTINKCRLAYLVIPEQQNTQQMAAPQQYYSQPQQNNWQN